MKNQTKLSLGLVVLFRNGLKIHFKSYYYKVKICNKGFVKIKISPAESAAMKSIISRVDSCRCSLEWLYLPLDNIIIKEGISTENL